MSDARLTTTPPWPERRIAKNGQASAVDDGGQVDVDDPPPVSRVIGEEVAVTDTGDVGDDVETTKSLNSRIECRPELLTVGHITRLEHDVRRSAGETDRVASSFLVAVDDDNRCPPPRQRDDGRPADAGCSACHESDAALDLHRLIFVEGGGQSIDLVGRRGSSEEDVRHLPLIAGHGATKQRLSARRA